MSPQGSTTTNHHHGPHGLRRARLISYCNYVERRYQSLHAFEHQLAERFGVGQRLERHLHFAVEQDLAIARFGA